MTKRDIFNELMEGFDALELEREGKITLKTTEVELPTPIKMSKTKIQRIRKTHNFSQGVFARVLGTNVKTYQNWEQGRSEPNEQAKILLQMVERNSQFLKELAEITTGTAVVVTEEAPVEKAVARKKVTAKKRTASRKASGRAVAKRTARRKAGPRAVA